MKIIHILCHTIPLRESYILDGWPARTARYINKYSSSYNQECWFAINNLKKNRIWEKDGITYKLYRSWTLNKALESFFGVIISSDLISDLKGEIEKNQVIVHIQGERSLLVWQIIQVAKRCPIVLQIHGYSTPRILIIFEKVFFAPIEKYFLKHIDYFFSSVKHRTDYLINDLGIPKERIINQNLGVDYEIFHPLDKEKIRRELTLPLDKKVILYVGLFNETKGVKKIIDTHQKIKDKYNTYLILIGGNKGDKYYNYCKKFADLVLDRIEHKFIPKYFSAADVYCMVCAEEKAKYGGLGIASMEAVACNIPILNSNLKDAPREISAKIGYEVHSTEDLVDKMISIFQNKGKFTDLRSISKPYFSWEGVINNTLKLYKSFSNRKDYDR